MCLGIEVDNLNEIHDVGKACGLFSFSFLFDYKILLTNHNSIYIVICSKANYLGIINEIHSFIRMIEMIEYYFIL